MKKIFLAILICSALVALSIATMAGDLDRGRALMRQGNLEAAALFFKQYTQAHPRNKKLTPEALAMTGRILDALSDSLTGKAEKNAGS